MPGFNTKFELDVKDVDLIESALHETVRELSTSSLTPTACDETRARLRETKDLLGRLHNQKVFYRPKDETYVGG